MKSSTYYFKKKTNILKTNTRIHFQICISVPTSKLNKNFNTEIKLLKRGVAQVLRKSLLELFTSLFSSCIFRGAYLGIQINMKLVCRSLYLIKYLSKNYSMVVFWSNFTLPPVYWNYANSSSLVPVLLGLKDVIIS